MPIRTYHDLDVFREAYAAALDVSRMVKRFPAFEQFELAGQLRRAARSIPANIVEGWGNVLQLLNLSDTCKLRSAPAMRPECGWT